MNTPVVPDNQIKMWGDPRFQILAEVDQLLNGSRVWAGQDWTYNPIHPVKYMPVANKIRKALDELYKEYGIEE